MTEYEVDYFSRTAMIFDYIEVFYNRTRLHSSLGYRSPETYEAIHARQPQEAA